MNTFEQTFSRPASERLEQSRLWDSVLNDLWNKRITQDATGKYKAAVDSKGEVVYFQDERGEWQSKDGKLWSRKGSEDTDQFKGTAKVEKDGTITVTNSDTGVTSSYLKNGSSTRSIVTSDGVTYSITKDASGLQISNKIDDEEWRSTDGVVWKGADGKVWNGNVQLDRFGQYTEHKIGGENRIQARSKELTKILDRQASIEKDWGVKIVKPGEQIRKYEKDYTCRAPTEAELKVLEVMLYRNQQMNVKNLTVSFVQAGKHTDGSSLWGTYQRQDDKGRIVIMPKHTAATGWKGLEGTLEHELVHHEQYENWGAYEWGSKNSPAFTTELNSKMGWRYDRDKTRYVISDRYGKDWIRGDGEWLPLVDGKPEKKDAITSSAMRDLARMRPSTHYFNNPGEMHAEGMSMFRMERQLLYKESPQFYETCKTWDQALLDAKYGKKADGQPKIIRDEKGVLVEATNENVDAISKAEAQWRKDLVPRPVRIGDRYFALDEKPGRSKEFDRGAQCEHCVQQEKRYLEFY